MMREEAVVLPPYPDGKDSDGNVKYSQGLGHSDSKLTASSPAIFLEQAFTMFAEDLIPREKVITRWLQVPQQQHEFDALVAGYYQAGSKMKRVVELINLNHVPEAMALFLTFNLNQGAFSIGLAGRRYREVRRYLKADYSDEPKPIPKLKLFRSNLVDYEEIDFPPETKEAA